MKGLFERCLYADYIHTAEGAYDGYTVEDVVITVGEPIT